MMINRFIADLNTASHNMPINSYRNDYVAVLDLSRRRDSVETRKTPSPYNTSSSRESASPHTSLRQSSTQHTTNSPKSFSNCSPNNYDAVAMPVDPAAVLQNHAVRYYYGPVSPLDGNCLVPHPSSSPSGRCLHGTTTNQVKHEYSHDPGNGEATYRQPILTRTPPSVMMPSTENLSAHLGTIGRRESSISTEEHIRPTSALPPLLYPKLMSRDRKISRPFKAYPRDPLAMAATFTATDALLDTQKAEKYNAFRKRMLEQIHASNGGRATVSNPKMRRNISPHRGFHEEHANDSSSGNEDQHSSGPDSGSIKNDSTNNNSITLNQNGVVKDAAYYERRKKNNAAAKKSRDRRRIKEDEIAVRAAFLEHENIELRIELAALKNQLAMLTANSNR